ELDIALEDMRTERLASHLRGGELVDRLAQGLWQRDDAALSPLLRAQVIEVRFHRVRELVALLDSLQARVEQRGEREIRVAGGGGNSKPGTAPPARRRFCRAECGSAKTGAGAPRQRRPAPRIRARAACTSSPTGRTPPRSPARGATDPR